MSTATAKRSQKNPRNNRAEEAPAAPQSFVIPATQVTSEPKSDLSERTWLISCVAILLLASLVRFYALDLKPMHHDEGVNGFFLTSLVRQGVYKYDPSNYHGPTLYYLALPGVAVFGLNTFAVRFLTAIFGLGTLLLVFSFRRYVGTLATLVAAALIAASPGAVYYSRYFIHETLFVFFTLGVVAASLRFYETTKLGYLILATISAALLFATKETAFVSLGTLGLAWLVSYWWTTGKFDSSKVLHELFRFPIPQRKRRERQPPRQQVDTRKRLTRFGGRDGVIRLVATAIGVFLLINVLFYSSFFTNWPGVNGAIQSLNIWTSTGTSEFHSKRFDTYLTWLLQEEMPIFLLAIAGTVIALFGSKVRRFSVFVAAWSFGILAAYSLIPYKTPWLMLSFIVPMAVTAGYGVQSLAQHSWGTLKAPAPALALVGIALLISCYQSFVLNFRQYDNDQYPYVYAHTSRELVGLVSEVERIAARVGNKELGVAIASPDNWPLPWYFRDYPRVGYVGSVADHYDPNDTPIVIGKQSAEAKEDQTAKLRTVLGSDYQEVGAYTLRPGVKLALFARRDLVTK